MLLILYFTVVVALPLALGIYVVLNGMQRTRTCPSCANETVRLQAPAHEALNRALRTTELQVRWCMTCGWRGTARLPRVPAPVGRPDRSPGADHVDIRHLEIDGQPWKVTVRCWSEEGRWLGQLMFIAPDGRACMEEESSLEGTSALEVLSTALALPDQTLAGRLRRAIH